MPLDWLRFASVASPFGFAMTNQDAARHCEERSDEDQGAALKASAQGVVLRTGDSPTITQAPSGRKPYLLYYYLLFSSFITIGRNIFLPYGVFIIISGLLRRSVPRNYALRYWNVIASVSEAIQNHYYSFHSIINYHFQLLWIASSLRSSQ
jgi:hypothetical protein